MMKLILVRHGRTQWNADGRYQGQSDVALAAEGVAQAESLAEHFPVEHLDAVYSSDLQRARTTAEIVAGRFGLEVRTEPAFREICFGKWEGLTYEQIVSSWPEAMANFLQHPDILEIPEGENFEQVRARAFPRLLELVREHEPHGHVIAIFAHGAVLRTLLASIMHIPLRYVWTLRQSNTAVNIVSYEEGWPTVELLNSTAHLTKKERRVMERDGW